MKSDSGSSVSLWMSTTNAFPLSPLIGDTGADVCIVGAGVAGLTTAYLLAREGRKVVVVEDGPVGGGETGRTTAHLSNALDDRYFEIERLHGENGARLAAASHAAAIDRIASIVQAENIDCDFARVDGYLFVPPGEDAEILERELRAAHRAGLRGVEKVAHAPLGDFDTGPALRFPDQAQFHPLRYLLGLASAVQRLGGVIAGGFHAAEFPAGPPLQVKSRDGRTVTAEAVVVATNVPVNDRVVIHTKQAAYRTYAIAVRVPPGAIPRALFWDTGDPYHYVRLHGDDLLIVGGEDHKTGQEDDPEACWTRLEAWTRERVPGAGALESRWSGQVLEPVDGLAFIGRNPGGPRGTYVVTGDSGNGMTHGTIAGILIADLVAGRDNAWATLYDPGRVTLRAAKTFTRENANVAAQYADLVLPGDVKDEAEVAPGCGAVIRHGLRKIALYRDVGGEMHRLSAVCPHLGGIVAWNAAEKTWDCPCHGSRFAPDGHVVNGPAISGLAREKGA